MRYANNEIRQIVNGVIFYFEVGDEEIATDVFEIVEASVKPPTSVVWKEECMSSAEALHKLQTSGLAEGEWVGVRLTTDDSCLLKEILELFKENYSALLPMVGEIESQLLVTRH